MTVLLQDALQNDFFSATKCETTNPNIQHPTISYTPPLPSPLPPSQNPNTTYQHLLSPFIPLSTSSHTSPDSDSDSSTGSNSSNSSGSSSSSRPPSADSPS